MPSRFLCTSLAVRTPLQQLDQGCAPLLSAGVFSVQDTRFRIHVEFGSSVEYRLRFRVGKLMIQGLWVIG